MTEPTRRLRVAQLIVTPVLMWDDGDELHPGPQAQPITVPLSRLAEVAANLPAEVAQMQDEILAAESDAENVENSGADS